MHERKQAARHAGGETRRLWVAQSGELHSDEIDNAMPPIGGHWIEAIA